MDWDRGGFTHGACAKLPLKFYFEMATTLVSIVTSTGSTVLDRKAQQSDGLPCEQTLGDGGKEKIPFNCKKHLEKPGQEGAATCLNQLG